MSMVANLHKDDMTCWCPACGEIVDVETTDYNGLMDNGDKEYYVVCPDCGQSFYAAESYENDEWEVRKYEEGIKSKFHVGQTVFGVCHSTLTKHVTCPACNGSGKVRLLNGQLYNCPECNSFGYKQKTEPDAYRIAYESTIGKVQVEIYKTRFVETYMIEATGVGSGQVWDSDKLFATKEEAEAYCRKMNRGEDIEVDAIEAFKSGW